MRVVLIALVLVSALVGVLGSIPVATPPSSSGPLGQMTLTPSGVIASEHPNPPTPNGDAPEQVPIRRHRYRKKVVAQPPKEEEKYLPGTDFLGAYGGVPINPTAHLQASLKDDKEYVASILRAPVDLGDPTNCQHSDILKDEQELRRIALRINHRRVSLRQQQHWIDSATEALRKIETEISQTTNTARNLAEEMDALTAQKEDITNHVKRAILLKELDRTSSNLMRLKDSRMQEEVELQKKHNKFALRNHEHNEILSKLHEMRTKHGLALGKLADPKPYRFAQQGLESNNQAQTETETETETEAQAEGESEQQTESTEEKQ